MPLTRVKTCNMSLLPMSRWLREEDGLTHLNFEEDEHGRTDVCSL